MEGVEILAVVMVREVEELEFGEGGGVGEVWWWRWIL